MKRSLFILITLLALSIIFAGCQTSVDDGNKGEIQDNNSASVEDNPNSSDTSEKNDDAIPKDDEDIGENKGDIPENSGDTSENESEVPKNDENADAGDENDQNETPLPEIGTSVGYRFADLTLRTMDGGSINTADLRGKIVILNLWASWCGPCQAELPDFDKIATEYKDQVVIIAADIDAGTGNAYNYVQQNFPESDIVFAYDTVYGTAYYLAGGNGYIPYTAIMDQNGVIVYSDSGILSHSKLEAIINELID